MNNTATILDQIKAKAIALWGDKWMTELTKMYVVIAKANGDDTATPVKRRPQIQRAFQNNGCHSETLLILIQAAGLEVILK